MIRRFSLEISRGTVYRKLDRTVRSEGEFA